ncbi:hypothetical protein [Microbulbifer mangrovi]|uniref:hypothetical protein n=1 Tax=Microbulbifer TaxID=48073 RepID=UPI00117F037A|nr:hypothetical protein [Microbulbifer mangrovi]
MENHLKKTIKLYDGDERGFIEKDFSCKCLSCGDSSVSRVVGGRPLSGLTAANPEEVVATLDGVKAVSVAGTTFYKIDGLPLQFQISSCDHCSEKTLIVLSSGEYQPGRYMANLIGLYLL